MTERIEPPKIAAHYPDRGIDCEFALEPAFQAMVNAAERALWSATEVYAALISLADAHDLGRKANVETDEQIRSQWHKVVSPGAASLYSLNVVSTWIPTAAS
jgi:hypothetical protein